MSPWAAMELLHGPTRPAARLRELRARPEPLLAAGAFDALSARLVEQAGFEAVYMTGFGTSASLLGRPDVGLLSGTEMADHAARLAAAVGIPLAWGLYRSLLSIAKFFG